MGDYLERVVMESFSKKVIVKLRTECELCSYLREEQLSVGTRVLQVLNKNLTRE